MIAVILGWTFISLVYSVYIILHWYEEIPSTSRRFLFFRDLLLLPTIVIMCIVNYAFKR